MQPRFTLKNLGLLSVKCMAMVLLFVLSAQTSLAQSGGADAGRQVLQTDDFFTPPSTLQVQRLPVRTSPARTDLTERPNAPTVVSTAGSSTLTNNNANATISFNFRNNNGYAVKITDLASICGGAGSTDVSVYYNTTAINGPPATITAANGWTLGGSATISAVGNTTDNTTLQTFLTGLNIQVPAGATYGIIVQAVLAGGTTANLRYSTPTGVPPTFSNGGCDIIAGVANVGYGGVAVPGAPTFTPRGFIGSVTFDQATCTPVNATAPVISSVPSSTCAGSPITLSIIGGSLNGAANWKWYTGSCGGTLVGTGNSITVSPAATTTYYVRGEGGCAPAAGPCGQQTVTVTSCTCLTPDVATICAGSVQPLTVTPNGVTTQTFTNNSTVLIPAVGTSGIAGPYPSNIAVSGLPTAGVTVQSVTLTGLTHTWPSDMGIVLVSPTGQAVELLANAGGSSAPGSPVTLVFSDAAGGTVPAPMVSGTYKCTGSTSAVNYPAPGPGSVTQASPTLATFAGNVNGNWSLYAVDQVGGDAGVLNSGFSITFRIAPVATWTPVTGLFTNAAGTTPYVAGTQLSTVYAAPATTTTYTANILTGPCAGNNTVTVNVLPRPAIAISPSPGGCAPANLTATGGTVYSWTPSTGLSATTGAAVTATPSTNTTYTVLGYGANGCSNTATVTVNGISTSAVISAPPAFQNYLNESFSVAALPGGWAEQNLSNPIGTGTFASWFQGTVGGAFTPFTAPDFRGAAYLCGSGTATLSNWLFTPQLNFKSGDQLTFYAIAAGTFPDRMQVRLSTNGASVNAGATATSVGDFTTLLQDINPTYTTTGFPLTWTKFTITIPAAVDGTSGRIAFRYFVENGGPNGANSNTIGLDDVQYNRPLAGICANNITNISVAITGGVSPYTVVFSNGTTNTTYNGYVSGSPIQVSPTVTTNYTLVSVTGANGCAGVGNTGTATVVVVPAPSVTTQPANVAACAGGNATFTVVAGPATGNTYQWQESTNGGSTWANVTNGGVYGGATTTSLTLTGVTTGMNGYRYRVVINGQCPPQPITSNAAILTVNTPAVITTQPANVTACDQSNATFSVVATGNNPTYQWQVSTDGGITYTNIAAGATGSSYTVAADLTKTGYRYRVVVTVAPCAAVISSAAILTVTPLPTVTITSSDLLITPGQTTSITASSTPSGVSYAWTLNGSPIAATTSSINVNIDGVGDYQATVLSSNGCSNKSNVLTIGSEASDRLWIYPNPTDGRFQVRLYYNQAYAEKRVVTIYNQLGQVITSKQFNLNTGSSPYLRMDFDLRNVPAGTYAVKVADHFTGHVTSGLVVIQ